MAFNPTCDCPWRGTPTFDHSDAVAQCRAHYLSEHALAPDLPILAGGLF
jgi:hypothetical protein